MAASPRWQDELAVLSAKRAERREVERRREVLEAFGEFDGLAESSLGDELPCRNRLEAGIAPGKKRKQRPRRARAA